MRILITQRQLIGFAGTEMVTVEVAKELSERGHEVIVFSPRLGDVASLLWASGARAISRLDQMPWMPEVIHGHHHLTAMAAMARFEGVPAVYYCHGSIPWVEKPPMHQGIFSYVVMCKWMVQRVVTEFELEPSRVTCIPNFVNTSRFSEVRLAPEQLKSAVLFHASGFEPEEVSRLESSCVALGLHLDKVGAAYRNEHCRPEVLLQRYDVAFASGRSALEAMATGCAVVTLGPGQAGGLVTMENYDQSSFVNFGPRYFTAASQINEGWLRRELAAYSPANVALVTGKVRNTRTLTLAVDQLEKLYGLAISSPVGPLRNPFANYMERLAVEVDDLWGRKDHTVSVHRRELDEIRSALHEVAGTVGMLRIVLGPARTVWKWARSLRRAVVRLLPRI